ncbi:MAG: NAD(P)/FAD-dependent oxidoreductase [Dehalococcoidia bacterium]|nr:MAG: NAD(P)/FAD-dependent oxidoreductase [Dehalococcoidia bacterium]
MAESRYDVIVVGAGFGGSACAGLLAKRGLKVLLLEKNARAGGKAMTLSKKGFTYTAWVVISAPTQGTLLEVVLKELGMENKVELVAPGVNGSTYKTSSGKWLIGPQPAPGEVMDPNKMFDWLEVKEANREESLRLMTELTMMSPQEIATLNDITFADWLGHYKVPKSVLAFLLGPVADGCFMVPYDTLSAAEAVRTLQDIFLRSGGVFCKGGFGKLAGTYAEAVTENGGKVIMRARVEKIMVSRGRVTGVATDKGIFQAPVVVSNAGLQPTVLKLVGEEHFDKGYVNYVKDLVPSWGMMGTRYFLSKKVTDFPYGTIFSNDSPYSIEKWLKAKAEGPPKEITVWYEVPVNYDPKAAPKGKQMLMTGFWCPADPQLSAKEKKAWWDKGEEMLLKVFPDLPKYIEFKEGYSTRDVSNLTRDQVLPGQGGECIGLGQVVDQAGAYKPSAKSPIQGLYYVGCDAGGYGVGIHQAVDSAINVAGMVQKYHLMHQAMQ